MGLQVLAQGYCHMLAGAWPMLLLSFSRFREANCESAMRLAQERLGVPMVVSPANMASADLDQLSGMTYLSYFMKLNSCGYKATLRDVNKILGPQSVSNFVVSEGPCRSCLSPVGTILSKRGTVAE